MVMKKSFMHRMHVILPCGHASLLFLLNVKCQLAILVWNNLAQVRRNAVIIFFFLYFLNFEQKGSLLMTEKFTQHPNKTIKESAVFLTQKKKKKWKEKKEEEEEEYAF